jgi:hypothetical protein
MANIFCLPQYVNDEDRFTSSLNYVIEFHQDLGQKLVDFILEASGLPSAQFIKSTDHPYYINEDRPDFRLECDKFDIICEHKLDAPLGHKQLERYLNLRQKRGFYLVLITASYCDVPDTVRSHHHYLKPNYSNNPYFRWQDFYHIFENYESKLVQDFAEYMQNVVMRPWNPEILGDLFESDESATLFSQSWEEVRQYFKSVGAYCQASGNLSFQVRKPETLEILRLLYLYVRENLDFGHRKCSNPYIAANIWVKKDDYEEHKSIFQNNYEIQLGPQTIYSQQEFNEAGWDDSLVHSLTFYTSLEPLLSDNINMIGKNILSFAVAIVNHINDLIRRGS